MKDAQDTWLSGVRLAQLSSIVFMWVFFLSISIWIFNLMALSIELQDALEATIAISIVAVPVYLTLACVLTYVFIGLRREERRVLRREPES